MGPSVLAETLIWPQLKLELIARSPQDRLGATRPGVHGGDGGSPAFSGQPVLGGSWYLGRKRGARSSKAQGSLASTEPLPVPMTLELRAWLPGVREPCGLAASPGWALTCMRLCCLPDQHILRDLEKKKILVFTPSRRVGGKRVVCYDDRFIVKLAFESDGIVVSNDTYRDLQGERQEWKRFIEERLLMYSFVNDKYVPTTAGAAREGLGWGGSVAEPCGLGPGQL